MKGGEFLDELSDYWLIRRLCTTKSVKNLSEINERIN
jgi:hypothetical protein